MTAPPGRVKIQNGLMSESSSEPSACAAEKTADQGSQDSGSRAARPYSAATFFLTA